MKKRSYKKIFTEFVAEAKVTGTKTNNPVIVAFVGVRGAGKSTIARYLKRVLGWPIVSKTNIRIALRERGRGFTRSNTDAIAVAMLKKIIRGGGNTIIDSDCADPRDQKLLEQGARKFHAPVVYIHATCKPDTLIRRMLKARFHHARTMFPDHAVAVREYARRLPWHFHWSPAGGGAYSPRRFGVNFIGEVDSTDPRRAKKQIQNIVKQLKKM